MVERKIRKDGYVGGGRRVGGKEQGVSLTREFFSARMQHGGDIRNLMCYYSPLPP